MTQYTQRIYVILQCVQRFRNLKIFLPFSIEIQLNTLLNYIKQNKTKKK